MFRDVPFNVMGGGGRLQRIERKISPNPWSLHNFSHIPVKSRNFAIPTRQQAFQSAVFGIFSHTLCFFRLCNPSLSISNGTDWNNSPQVKRLCIYGQYLKGVSPLLSPPEQNWGLTAKYNHLIFRNCMYSSWSFLTNTSGNSFIDTKQGMPCQLVKHQALSTFHTHPDSLMGLLTPI